MLLSKNNIGISTLLLLFCFNTVVTFSQTTTSGLSQNMNPQGERNILEDRALWVEVVSERKAYSSTYTTPDGRIITYYSKQLVNYTNANGILVPVNTIPASTSKGLTAANQPNEVSVLNNGSVEIKTDDGSSIGYSANAKVNGLEIVSSELKVDGANASMQNVFPGINKTFEFRFNSVKYNYVITTPTVVPATDLVIEEELSMPENSKKQCCVKPVKICS